MIQLIVQSWPRQNHHNQINADQFFHALPNENYGVNGMDLIKLRENNVSERVHHKKALQHQAIICWSLDISGHLLV